MKITKRTFNNIISENMNFSFKNSNKVNIDTLILVGEKEKRLMIESARSVNEKLPSSKAYIIKNVAHGIPYEQPELLNKLVYNFITDKGIIETNIVPLKENGF
ncbi:alpha/beta fold hydrolase [Clostridium sediminicola]|uniref:alpha/beta fold hydrolase n=1 Tax=Clostridium sediminicola TaxID=3114879 RepID=UPI003D173482